MMYNRFGCVFPAEFSVYTPLKGIFMSDAENSLTHQVENVLAEVRQMIQRDGGDLELVSVDEDSGLVKVRFQGACVGCPSAAITFQNAIERTLKQQIPQVQAVELVSP